MSGPLSPREIENKKERAIPELVFEAFNEMIAREFFRGQATVMQKDVVERILEKMAPSEQQRADIFDKRWLDVEEAYRRVGWRVEFEKPGYNENFAAFFIFTKAPKTNNGEGTYGNV